MGKIFGMDLGTGNCCFAVMENGNPVVVVNESGDRTTPSVVGFTKNGRLVGKAAKNQATTNPKNTIVQVKRCMGARFADIKADAEKWSYKVVDNGTNVRIEVEENGEVKRFSPEEISAIYIQKAKEAVEAYLGEPVTEAVITCPAYYNDEQRNAVKAAGQIAGVEVKRIINEPTAAALAFGIKDSDSEKKIAVTDFGSGTADVTILEVGDGVFEVKSTSGDTHLGGTDFDNRITDWIIKEFKNDTGIDLSKDPMALQRVREAAENAKIALSSQTSTNINIPFITADATGPKHLNKDLTRAKFEELSDDLFDRHKKPMLQALKDAGLKPEDIDEVLLVGGTTRIPKIQEIVKEVFGKEGNKSVNPDEAVALGAAIQAGVIAGDVKDVLLLDVTPLSLSIETLGGVATKLIEKNTTIPTRKTQVFSTAADGQTAVTIVVCQGEREFVKDNKILGTFNLEGIPAAPRGVPQIEVSMDLDANGILTVSAKDLGTGKEQKITVSNSGNLSKEEIERMKADAEAHAAEDKKRKEAIDIRNMAESMIANSKKSLDKLKDKISASDKETLEKQISELEEALKGTDDDLIKSKFETLQQTSYKVAEEVYKQNPQPNSADASNFTDAFKNMTGAAQADDGTTAEYTVKD